MRERVGNQVRKLRFLHGARVFGLPVEEVFFLSDSE